MPEEFDIQKLKKEYPELFEEFSPELFEFLFSEETSSKIAEICLENGVEDEEKIEKIAYRISLVLFNQVPKENLTRILERGVNLPCEIAERISMEVNRRIFSQAPEVLKKEEQLTQPAQPSLPSKPEVAPPPEVKPKVEPKEARKDIYREPFE